MPADSAGNADNPEAPRDLEAFRAYVRNWAPNNLERSEAQSSIGVGSDDELFARAAAHRATQRKLYDAGLAGLRYPREFGGQDLSHEHQVVFVQETQGYAMPTLLNVTLGILGPTILDFGTDEQKQAYLPDIVSGATMWVQMLSEPSGGSDMAGALTSAVRDGDTYVVNGAKIWTTSAHLADYALLLARTDPEVPKHRGLSMIIVPLRDTPGLTIRPIKLAAGASDFCEEFMDDMILPSSNLVGRENDGWSVASRLLFHERGMTGGVGMNDSLFEGAESEDGEVAAVALARRLGLGDDPVTRQLVGESIMLSLLGPVGAEYILGSMRTGRIPAPGASMLKLLNALIGYRQHVLGIEIGGAAATVWSQTSVDEPVGLQWLGSRVGTVGGGTNEMQLNQISERVLDLPREASPDRDLPFSQVRHNRTA